jgi:hypothetical protein
MNPLSPWRRSRSMMSQPSAHEDVAIASEVHALAIRGERGALLHARGVDGIAEVAAQTSGR